MSTTSLSQPRIPDVAANLIPIPRESSASGPKVGKSIRGGGTGLRFSPRFARPKLDRWSAWPTPPRSASQLSLRSVSRLPSPPLLRFVGPHFAADAARRRTPHRGVLRLLPLTTALRFASSGRHRTDHGEGSIADHFAMNVLSKGKNLEARMRARTRSVPGGHQVREKSKKMADRRRRTVATRRRVLEKGKSPLIRGILECTWCTCGGSQTSIYGAPFGAR